MKRLNLKEQLSQLAIDGEKQLFFICFLSLILPFKFFLGNDFTGFKNMLIDIVKLIRLQNFSLFDIINTIGRFQMPICKFLIFMSFCGLIVFGIWCAIIYITLININRNIHQLLGNKTLRMLMLCINFYVIYDLLIVIFSNGPFLILFDGFWKYVTVSTFSVYMIMIGFYLDANKNQAIEKPESVTKKISQYFILHLFTLLY